MNSAGDRDIMIMPEPKKVLSNFILQYNDLFKNVNDLCPGAMI